MTDIGDGGPATSAFIAPIGLAVDSAGDIYVVDATNRIRKFAPGGTINTVAGSNTSNFSGDGGPATNAGLNDPSGVAIDADGSLYIVDRLNYRVRKVARDGAITTIAGNGKPAYSGDGGPALSASLKSPGSIALGPGGAIYVTDEYDYSALVRRVAPALGVPQISTGGVVPVYSSAGAIQPGEWVSIFGSNLASETVTWKGDFPTLLGGTSVTINGKSAYLSYVSSTQVNLQAPDDVATGPVNVVVTTAGGSATSTVTLGQFGPSFSLLDAKHVAGIIIRSDGSGAYGGGAYDIVGPSGTSLGYKTVAAKAGDVLELFGVGFGPTNPAVPAGKLYTGAAPTTNTVQLLINNIPVTPAFSGLTAAGLFQLNITLPGGLGAGDVALQATVGGVKTPSGVVLSLQ